MIPKSYLIKIACALLAYIVFSSLLPGVSASSCPAETLCNNTAAINQTSAAFDTFCSSHSYVKDGRCCSDNSTSLAGLDLSNCSLYDLHLQNVSKTLQALFLTDNPLHNCTDKEFLGFVNLEYITLPATWRDCPGGPDAWRNATSQTCMFQRDYCKIDNMNCTENSVCNHLGPGTDRCQCKPGHYGYKCLFQGHFPLVEFVSILATVTLVLSFVSYACLGRHIKTD